VPRPHPPRSSLDGSLGRLLSRYAGCGLSLTLVAFFEPVNTPPPNFDLERTPLPWEEDLGQTVFNDVDLARGPLGAILLRSLIVFPKVMTLSVVALFRHPLVQGPGTRGDNSPTFGHSPLDASLGTGVVLFGLRFSDGTCYRNLDERGSAGHLGGLQGGSRGFTGYREFWAPLPPPSELELWAAWPAAQITETRTVLDASLIAEKADALQSPWA
jgi:hypothetical protein